MGWSEGWPVRRMEVHVEMGQEHVGRLLQTVEVIPPAMSGQVLLQVAVLATFAISPHIYGYIVPNLRLFVSGLREWPALR